MSLLIEHDSVAEGLLIATFAVVVLAEAVATSRRHGRGLLDGLLQTTLVRQAGAAPADRNTKTMLVGAQVAGIVAAVAIAKSEPLRLGADNWATLVAGLLLILAGYGMRVWAVWELGRFFRREVIVQEGQHVVESGPYRVIRHPAYLGNVITMFGVALAIGSWLGTLVMTVIVVAGLLPRIFVEERELTRALPGWPAYAAGRARLIPRVW